LVQKKAERSITVTPKKNFVKKVSYEHEQQKKVTHAELATAGSDALLRRTVSIIWMTPLLIRTSGRTIFALKPLDSTKVPEELVTNCRGSPAAEVVL
jgi:hypothetical protein